MLINPPEAYVRKDGGASVGWHADDESLFQGKHQDIRDLGEV